MTTEGEAKTRWCPFARMLTHIYSQDGQGRTFEGGYSYNRSPDDGEGYVPTGAKCIGSACMAWRWREIGFEKGDSYTTTFVTNAAGEKVGFCGLAGRPA